MFRKFKNWGHALEACLAKLIFKSWAKKIFMIGVTGTDGKTTTATLIFHILKTAGFKTALISTIGAQIGDRKYDTGLHTTTPSAFLLHKYIKRAKDAGCIYLVLEVTSHALDQNRVWGIDFKIGVLTNISHEHLDYHGTYEKYVRAKIKLFKNSEIVVLNKDDGSYGFVRENLESKSVYSYSLNGNADFTKDSVNITIPHAFEFNASNFLAAVAVAKILKIPDEKIKHSISSFKFPKGRQEIVYEGRFRVIIDFAHTPNAFANILPALKKATGARLIHVFGSAGERDRSKRPLMGGIASKFDDIIILTAEDPRIEKIEEINNHIKAGINRKFVPADHGLFADGHEKNVYFEISDRQEAISFAVSIAREDDIIVITGKGHEKSMNFGGEEVEWSDHEAVKNALAARKKP